MPECTSATLQAPATGVAIPLTAAPAAERQRLRTLAILSALMAFGPLSTDFYLPALPTMAQGLGCTPGAMEWTISSFLIGCSVGQLFWGPLSDKYGRRAPVAAGIAIFVLGSVGCALSTSVGAMIAWRFVQALGACAGIALSRAMVRDLYAGARSAQMMSALITVMAVTPLIGPLVGGQILRFASWPFIFWLLAAVGVATLLALLSLPETLPAHRRRRDGLGKALRTYALLIGDRRILGFAAVGAFLNFGVFAYVAGTPFAYIKYYGVRPEFFGFIFASGIIGIMISNVYNARQVVRSGIVPILRLGAILAAGGGVWAAADAWAGAGGLVGLAAPLFVFIATNGLIVANSVAGALTAFPKRAGTVSALVGALQYGAGMAGSGLLGAFADGTPRPLAFVVAVAGVGAAVCAWTLVAAPRRVVEG
jgi:DHA1 family bicyclomycin/chloramphenicol resistance-like MFS transporter